MPLKGPMALSGKMPMDGKVTESYLNKAFADAKKRGPKKKGKK